jgi:hypothetical protein
LSFEWNCVLLLLAETKKLLVVMFLWITFSFPDTSEQMRYLQSFSNQKRGW